MTPPNLTPPPATAPPPSDIPDFAELAADPEIAPLLGFVPVVRKIKRPDGWFPELQRELIARIAATGTVQAAVWQMGKHATGAEALYKVPNADSFRASWDAAVAIGRRRNGLDSHPPFAGPIPGINRRRSQSVRPEPVEGRHPSDDLLDADHQALALSLFGKYLQKVQGEREARLAGRVVEADLYLRQLTFFEVMMDLAQEAEGVDTWTWLAGLRRDGQSVIHIARTPFSQFLDEARRMVWEGKLDEPPRPASTPEHYFVDRNGYSLEPGEPFQGTTARELEEHRREMAEKHRRAAEEQVEWEARATERS